jgi:hypothetical protein
MVPGENAKIVVEGRIIYFYIFDPKFGFESIK